MADVLLGEWNFVTTTTAPPSTGQMRLDSMTPASATKVWVSKTDATNADASAALAALKLNYRITLQNKGDTTKALTYRISGAPVDQGAYMEYPAAWLTGDPTLPNGQRTNLINTSIPVSVPVTSPALQAKSGTVATAQGVGVSVVVKSPALAMSTGTPTFSLGVAQEVTGIELAMSVGTPTFKLDCRFPVTGQVLQAQAGSVNITGRIYIPGQAFPSDTPMGYSGGMTLRQWYVGQAMMGLISYLGPTANLVGRLADISFRVADSMLEFEKKEQAGVIRPPVPARPPPFPPSTLPVPLVPRNITTEEMVARKR